MLTQCPHCLTLFRVGPEHLRAAEGQVRCSRCNQIFNALESLRETPSSFTNDPMQEADEDSASLTRSEQESFAASIAPETSRGNEADEQEFVSQETPAADFETLLPNPQSEDESQSELDDILEQDDGLEPAPDYLDIGTESQMSELLDQDSSSLLLPDSEPPALAPAKEEEGFSNDNIVSFTGPLLTTEERQDDGEPSLAQASGFEDSILKDQAIDEELGKPDYDSVPALRDEMEAEEPPPEDDRALRFEAEESTRPRDGFHRPWLIGSLLLLIPLSGQLIWHFRDNLIHHGAGRQTLGLICSVAGCQVPVRRDLERIVIAGRNLTTHPDKPDTLRLQLSLVNTAPFEQPFPQLALSLFNDNGSLIARRVFTTEQYLPDHLNRTHLMPQAESVLVQIDLIDPGKEVTGFSFDFY
jgi:predicted Zn finger-like uncharacterized protein